MKCFCERLSIRYPVCAITHSHGASPMMRVTIAAITLILGVTGPVQAFGPKGHSMVGAIADQRLAGKPVSTKVSDLLDGLTLAEAALLPDNIKDWDFANPETDPDTFHLPTHPVIEQD